jgi:hypothetical protein
MAHRSRLTAAWITRMSQGAVATLSPCESSLGPLPQHTGMHVPFPDTSDVLASDDVMEAFRPVMELTCKYSL